METPTEKLIIENNLTDKFVEYLSINNLDEKITDKFMQFSNSFKWIALEKIHGANLSFITDGQTICIAKRTSVLAKSESFFSADNVLKKYEKDIFKIFENVKKIDPETKIIQIFGEIFGGMYPRSEKPCDGYPGTDFKQKPVQREVYYCNEIDFMFYDIFVNSSYFMSHSELQKVSGDVTLKLIPVLYSGTFKELSVLDPEFQSMIYSNYGLPKLDNNLAEGYVIKADTRYTYIHNQKQNRLMLKHKSVKFVEYSKKAKPILDLNQVTDEKINQIIDDCVPNGNTCQQMLDCICYCTKNRYSNTVSKHEEDANPHKLIGVFISDAVNDYIKDMPGEQQEFLNKIIKQIRQGVHKKMGQNKLFDAIRK